MFKYTQTTLEKMEHLMRNQDYVVRYEKGNFKSGYCILQNKRVVVISKFFDTESRINCLVDIIPQLKLNEEQMEEKERELFNQMKEAQLQQ